MTRQTLDLNYNETYPVLEVWRFNVPVLKIHLKCQDAAQLVNKLGLVWWDKQALHWEYIIKLRPSTKNENEKNKKNCN